MSKMNEKATWNRTCPKINNVWWSPEFLQREPKKVDLTTTKKNEVVVMNNNVYNHVCS